VPASTARRRRPQGLAALGHPQTPCIASRTLEPGA
jgi:hypothetical protein